MAKGNRHTVRYRRAREGRTNYHTRLALLRSDKPRLVVRKSNNYIICQIVKYSDKGDKIITSAISKELAGFGWKSAFGNIPAAYLTGLLIGKRATSENIKEAVLDIGIYPSTKGAVIYSALKGALNMGLSIPHNNKILPSEDRVQGKHIKSKKLLNQVKTVKNKIKNKS